MTDVFHHLLIWLAMTPVILAAGLALAALLVYAFVLIRDGLKYGEVSEQLSSLSWEIGTIGHWAHNEHFTDAEFRRLVKDKTAGRSVVAR